MKKLLPNPLNYILDFSNSSLFEYYTPLTYSSNSILQ